MVFSNSLGLTLADKIKVAVSPKIYRRVKDLYDLYVICTTMDVPIADIRDDFLAKLPDFPEISEYDLESLQHAYGKLRVSGLKPPFEDLFDTTTSFIFPLLDYVYSEEVKGITWKSKVGVWE